jgi:3-isopropylmalate dehydrogenase
MKLEMVILPGDGIGPEVTAEAIRVLEVVASAFGHQIEASSYPFGSEGIKKAGKGFPDETREACLSAQAVLLGAVGDPAYDKLPPSERPEASLLELRRVLGNFANLRPIVSRFNPADSPFRDQAVEGTDLLIVRELTGGLYFGEPRGRRAEGEGIRAWNTMTYSSNEVERIARVAFEAARGRRGRVTSVDKSNVLETSMMWREIVERVGTEHPDVRLDHMYVDRAAMEIVSNPKQFDVIVTGNLFGDILSDEASVLAGSLGLLPSASIGGKVGIYEPVHGSAPDIAGRGIANPIGAIDSMAMMLRYSFKLEQEANAVEKAIEKVMQQGQLTADLVGAGKARSTQEVGGHVADAVAKAAASG